MYLPILAGLVAALFWGLSDYLITKPTRALGQYRTTAYAMLFSTIVLLPFLLLTGINLHISPLVLLLAILSSIGAFVGFFFAYRAYKIGDLSITAPIVGSYPAIIVLGSVLILGDKLTLVEIASIITIIVGIILVSTRLSSFKHKRKLVVAGVGSALIAMLFLGTPGIFAGAYTVIIGFVLLSLMWRSITSASGFITGHFAKQDMRLPAKRYLLPIIGAGVTDAFAVLAFLYAVQVKSSTLPIISAISGFAGAVTVICAFILLKERPEKNQWLGITLAVIGVIALSYFA